MIKVFRISQSEQLLPVMLLLIWIFLCFNRQLIWRIETITIGQAWHFEILELQPHHLVLLLELFDLIYLSSHLLEFGILLFQMKQLLVNVTGTPTSLQVEDLFEVLDLFLELLNVRIICGSHLVGLDLDHDLFGSISKLESGNSLLNVVNDW